jgi:leader peptidase (prepilin peptidase)/N-methyltransferase
MLIDSLLRSGLILILLYLAWFDLRTFLLPNKVTYPLILLGLFINTLTPYALCEPTEAWIGALVAYSSLYLINQIYRQLRNHDGLGMGDAKLFAALGSWLGIAALPFILLIASLLGIIGGLLWLHHNKLSSGHAFPFGPFLVIAGIIEVLWSSQFLNSLI